MPEVEFTIDTATGEFSSRVEGVPGPACDDVAKLVKALAGEPAGEQATAEYQLRPRIQTRTDTRLRSTRG